jgi:hypothetical protein
MLRRFEAMEDASAYAGCLSTFVALQQKEQQEFYLSLHLLASLLSANPETGGGKIEVCVLYLFSLLISILSFFFLYHFQQLVNVKNSTQYSKTLIPLII